MYDEIWGLIQAGDYRLEELSYKIDLLWLAGRLTQAQRDDLRALAQEQAQPEQEAVELAQQIQALAERVSALEALHAQEETPDQYPDWVRPIVGLTTNYQYGDIVQHNGQLWQSQFQGQNVWEPGVLGTETLWVVYTPDTP